MQVREASRGDIERAVRVAYPTGALDDLEPEALDQHLSIDQLPLLLERISTVEEASAVLETEIVKTHVLHVGS